MTIEPADIQTYREKGYDMLTLRPHGRSARRVSRARDSGIWMANAQVSYPYFITRAQAAQAAQTAYLK